MNIKQIRDLTVISIDEKRYMGISCDSCGGIGNKEHDMVKAPPEIVASQTTKVVIAELLSMGFTPLVLSNGLAVEMDNTGKELIDGFNSALSTLTSCKVHLTGSTEENMKTVQTSMGVTGIGICDKDKLKYKKTSATDIAILIGLPLVGNQVVNNPDKIMALSDFETLYLNDFINEILPIGSRGIKCELDDLCKYNNLEFKYEDNITVDLKSSGGPSTCCIIAINKSDIDKAKSLVNKPMQLLGCFF